MLSKTILFGATKTIVMLMGVGSTSELYCIMSPILKPSLIKLPLSSLVNSVLKGLTLPFTPKASQCTSKVISALTLSPIEPFKKSTPVVIVP